LISGEEATNTYTWNARNQLTQVSQGGVVQLSYTYDAMGRRTSKAVQSGTPTQFLYDGANAVQEVQGSTVNSILTGLGVDERFARNDATGRTYFLTDALNSTIALTDPTGAIREQYSYDPYGNVTPSDTTTGFTNPYQYTGREADTPGLYYYRARYYSPMMGGFISEDPAGFAGRQLSFYAYVNGDPLDRTDPLGLINLVGQIGGGGYMGVGGEGAIGVYLTGSTTFPYVDAGVYGTTGGGGGEMIGAGLEGGLIKGNESDIEGVTLNAEGAVPGVGGEVMFAGGEPVGFVVGPAAEAGVAISGSRTWAFGLNDIGYWLGGKIYEHNHPYNPNAGLSRFCH
jgi:RHS repeat-associated protein